MHPEPTARRRRHTGAAVVLSIGALLVTAGSAFAGTSFAVPDDSAVSPPPPSQPTRANGDTKHTTRLYGKNAFQEAVVIGQVLREVAEEEFQDAVVLHLVVDAHGVLQWGRGPRIPRGGRSAPDYAASQVRQCGSSGSFTIGF